MWKGPFCEGLPERFDSANSVEVWRSEGNKMATYTVVSVDWLYGDEVFESRKGPPT